MRHLYRSRTDQKIGGVLGGLAAFLNVDSTILRLAWVVITIFSGFFFGILTYLVALLIIPQLPEEIPMPSSRKNKSNPKV